MCLQADIDFHGNENLLHNFMQDQNSFSEKKYKKSQDRGKFPFLEIK